MLSTPSGQERQGEHFQRQYQGPYLNLLVGEPLGPLGSLDPLDPIDPLDPLDPLGHLELLNPLDLHRSQRFYGCYTGGSYS